eukprot:gnl/MRDRNA2_/MRDRNA2_75904_c0_seq1.p1 gnl/MRDRNA2_/MRDRNA2_75904_c0~~gnl/MRDRNA2_/MRDRNA2_75904_c0_seq1.p1  ORF type:complete len:626 (-),score=115.22 gnl/MRDRNA2_/MRDRNA2_75904_c0_seq1:64-1941(-)
MRHVQNALQYLGYVRDDQVKVFAKRQPKAATSRPTSTNLDVSFTELDATQYEAYGQGHLCTGQESRYQVTSRNEMRAESSLSMCSESWHVLSSQDPYLWSKQPFPENPENEGKQQYSESVRPQWAPGRLKTKGPMARKDAPTWTERHHVSNSHNNSLVYYLRRSYFDKLPTTRIDVKRSSSSHRGSKGRAANARNHIERLPLATKDPKQLNKKPPLPRQKSKKVVEEDSSPVPVLLPRGSLAEPEILKKLEAELHSPGGNSKTKPALREFVVFYHWCMQRFGNLTRCWRTLDKDLNMRITRTEFLASLQDQHFRGNAQLIFTLLDRDHSGNLMYYHFDPTGALDLAEIACWAKNNFGSMQKAFKKLDADGNGKLTLQEFSSGASAKGLNAGPMQGFFNMLDMDRDQKVTLAECKFLDSWLCPQWLNATPDVESARHFTDALLLKYKSNGILAWRQGLDLDGNMRVSWDEFEKAVQYHPDLSKMNYAGVWRVYDENLSGWLSLREFNPKAHKLLVMFKSYCLTNHGTLKDAFAFIDANGNQVVSRKELAVVGRELGLDDGDVDILFYGLDLDGCGHVTLSMLKYLDRWDIEAEQEDEEFWGQIAECLRSRTDKRVSFFQHSPRAVY